MGAAVAATFDGRTFTLTTLEGAQYEAQGVFKKSHRELSVGDYGAKSFTPIPRLDLVRSELVAAGLTDPTDELHGASLTADGTRYTVAEVRDGEVFIRLMLSLDLS
jgi:hypothetical protein